MRSDAFQSPPALHSLDTTVYRPTAREASSRTRSNQDGFRRVDNETSAASSRTKSKQEDTDNETRVLRVTYRMRRARCEVSRDTLAAKKLALLQHGENATLHMYDTNALFLKGCNHCADSVDTDVCLRYIDVHLVATAPVALQCEDARLYHTLLCLSLIHI